MESQLVGIYNFSNAAAAIAMGCFFEVSLENIKKGIASYTPNNNRSQIIQKGSNTIILDAYNANPSSMEVALDNFNSMKSPLKIVILGDMFELGVHSKSEHQAVIDEVNSLNFSSSYYVGSHFFELAYDSSKANFFKSLIDEIEHLALIKGVVTSKDKIMVRVHSFNPVLDILEQLNDDGQNNLIFKAMKKIDTNKSGIIIIINDSYKDFITKKLKVDEEIDTKEKLNLRQYGVGAQILSDLGVKKMILLSNSKKKAIGLKGFDLSIVDWERLD